MNCKDKLIQKIENNEFLWQYAGNLLLFLVFWGGLLRKNFNADTIFHMVVDDADIMTNVEAGRYIISLGDLILFQMGLRTTTVISVTMLVTFLLFALVMTRVYRLFEKFSPEDKWLKAGYFIGTELVFLNVLFVELLMFNEYCVYFAFGYLAAVLAVEKFAKRKYVPMFLWLIVSACTYQYAMIFAAVMIAAYVCLTYKAELSLQAVKEEIIGICSCMGIGFLNYLSVIIMEKTGIIKEFGKNASVGNMGEKLKEAVFSFVELNKSSAEIFPDVWLPLLFAAAVWVLILYSCIKNKTLKKAVYLFIVYAGSMLLLYVIPLMQSKFQFPPRMSFCFYLVQGMLVVMAFGICERELKNLLSAGCICYLVIHLLFSQFIVSNRFVSNTLDEVYANMVYQEILKYEAQTGKTVSGLAVVDDAYAPDYYDEVSYTSSQINERALGTVTNSLLWVMSGREFQRITMPGDIYNEYFKGKDWDYFDISEQLVIIDDVAYWCVF